LTARVVVFRQGKRYEAKVPRGSLDVAKEKVRTYRAKGYKAHLVLRTDRGSFPPPYEIREYREMGMLWCPYCRAWRWFTVPKFVRHTEIGSDDWFMNSFHRQGVKVCKWCRISVSDWWVCKANGIFHERTGERRRRKKRTR